MNIINCVKVAYHDLFQTLQKVETLCTSYDLYLHTSFLVYEHPATILENLELETSHHLICHLETNVMLFHPGELTWLSYIICGSLLDWLNQYSCIEASIASCCPSLTGQKCGLYNYMAFLSDNWGLICQLMFDNRERNKQNCNGEARPSRTRSCDEIFQPEREYHRSHA